MNTKQCEKILKAFANRRRIEIIKYLEREIEATVGDIAEEIRLSFKATSKHLSVLSAADLVEKEQRSLAAFYSLTSDPSPLAKTIISAL